MTTKKFSFNFNLIHFILFFCEVLLALSEQFVLFKINIEINSNINNRNLFSKINS